jgi:transcriptional regulator with XRE-family HTH domain
MNASGGVDDHAAVGRRIVQARRQLELTQSELAERVGVLLGMLDKYESGQADASRVLPRIAEVTGKPIDWFTSTAPEEAWNQGDSPAVPTAVGQRIADSRGRRGLTRRELAEAVGVSLGKIERYESGEENPSELVERIATALGEPSSWLETGDPSGRTDRQPSAATATVGDAGAEPRPMNAVRPAQPEATASQRPLPAPPLQIPHEDLPRKTLGYNPKATAELFDQVAETYERLWEEHHRLLEEHVGVDERLDVLRGELAEERRNHGETAEQAARLQKELERANASRQALEALLKMSKSQLDARPEDSRLPERVSELETALREAEERAAKATERLEESERELTRFREQERSLAEALVWARHTASELSEKARMEAETLVQDAQRRAAELVAEGQREVERLAGERNRLESLTSEVQEDLAQFLLGTLDRLKQRAGSSMGSDNPGS